MVDRSAAQHAGDYADGRYGAWPFLEGHSPQRVIAHKMGMQVHLGIFLGQKEGGPGLGGK